jgi:hypothetical protein
MDESATPAVKKGDRIEVTYADKQFEVIVIDSDGLGPRQPSYGFGFMMAAKYIGIPQPTLTKWVIQSDGVSDLKTPSGKTFRVIHLLGNDGNNYSVIEASDWFSLSTDVLINPGQTRKPTKQKIADFLKWFAVKGFYFSANIAVKGVATAKDDRALNRWLQKRESGKYTRKDYTDTLSDARVPEVGYAIRTNEVYMGLFGLKAAEMKEKWHLMAGDPKIARNYISEEKGLEAVKFCERLVTMLYSDDLDEAHAEAIRLTVRKFKLHPQFP